MPDRIGDVTQPPDRSALARLAAIARGAVRGHALPLGLFFGVALWLTRAYFLSSQLPAGTDMLGFVSRSAENANLSTALSFWAPTSLGFPRTWSLDNVSGLLTIVSRNPVLTVKLLVLLVIFATGASAYLLAWSWYRRRTVALVAGLLYMLSQAALSRWGSGQLNVQMTVALSPILLWSWSLCLRRFTLRRALGLALLVTAVLLIRLDMILYAAPFMVLYLVVALCYPSAARPLRNAALTLAVAVPAALALNANQILPVVLGLGPKYLTSGQLFDSAQVAVHTLNTYPSLLGLGREIGYFDYTDHITWDLFPFLPLWGYYAAASLVVICAFLALAWERHRHTIFLVAMALVAVFAGKGAAAPFGGLYAWLIGHVVIVSDLRDPNRWLVFEALALAVLAGLTVDRVVRGAAPLLARARIPVRWGALVGRAGGVILVAAMLVQVSPIVASGLSTWQPPADELQLLTALGQVPNAGLAASIPYDQTHMFVDTPAYTGNEHDLGYESQLFSGVPVIGIGDWEQHTADFVAYTSRLLGSGDPAFVKLLASVGVSHLVSLNEPIVAAQLVEPNRGSYYQQTEARQMAGLQPTATTPGGTLYALQSPDPEITFRPNIAVILGGRSELAAFADLPGIDASSWAAFDADDVLAEGGLPRLISLISQASLVVAGGAQPDEIAALAAPALARLPGITSDPQVGRGTLLLPSDQGAFDGGLMDATQPIPLPETTSSSSAFTLASEQRVEVWADMETSSDAADVTVTVDGRTLYSQAPLAVGADAFRWVLAGTVTLPAGRHLVTIGARGSAFGDTFEVDETRVVTSTARTSDQRQLEAALNAASAHVAYALNLDTSGSYADAAQDFEPTGTVPGIPVDFWAPAAGTTTTAGVTPAGAPDVQVALSSARTVYTSVAHSFASPQDWADRPYVFLTFRGTASGVTYQVQVSFGSGSGQAVFALTDDQKGWRTVALPTDAPSQSSNVDWSDVTAIRVAAPLGPRPEAFALGGVRLSGEQTSIPVTYPAPYAAPSAAPHGGSSAPILRCAQGGPAGATASLSGGALEVSLPVSLVGDGCRAIVLPSAGIDPLPVVVPRTTAGAPLQATFTAGHSGVLVFEQAYDPGWQLSADAGVEAPMLTQSVVNGYLLPAGEHSITLTYSGDRIGMIGLAVTLLVLVGICILMWRVRPSPRRWQASKGVLRLS